jgi:hypothetical protein
MEYMHYCIQYTLTPGKWQEIFMSFFEINRMALSEEWLPASPEDGKIWFFYTEFPWHEGRKSGNRIDFFL